MTAAFDLRRLFRSIDAERERQHLTWTALSRHVGVAASTIRRYGEANDAEADGVLTLIQWLDGAPEDFITGNSIAREKLPSAERGRVRVDMDLVATALDDSRGADGRSRTTIQRLVEAAQRSSRSIASLTRLSDA